MELYSPQVIRTETGFAVLFRGLQFPLQIGYFRVSEIPALEKLLEDLIMTAMDGV